MTAPSMYEAIMGASFQRLPTAVQAFHRLKGKHVLHGQVRTEAPVTFLARLLARSLGSPLSPSEGPIRFELDAHPDHEVWVRHFPTKTMMSRLSLYRGGLTESLGLTRLDFDLEAANDRLVISLKRLHFLGVPCPAWAMPMVVAEEEGRDGNVHFNVRASLPIIGLVAGYRGYLVIEAGGPTP